MSKPNFRMNNRLVSARFWGNEDLAELASRIPNLKLTMIGLWAFADEAGIFEWKPRIAASLIYPLEPEKQADVEPAMNAFVETTLLKKIEVDGVWYGSWPNWGEHNSFRNNDSRYPKAALALGCPVKGSSTLKTPQEASSGLTRPLETEVEVEVEVGVGKKVSEYEAASPKQEIETPNPTPDEATILCELISSYSGNNIKEDWAKYAKAILKVIPLDKLKPVLEWIYVESDFWGERTFNTKNLFDHLEEGNLLKKYNAVRALQKKRVAKVKAEVTPSAPGAHGNKSGMEL